MISDSVLMVAQLGGELVSYTPYGAGARSFKAIVNRRPNQVQNIGKPGYYANTMELQIPNDPVYGVTVIQEGQDKVSFKRNLDDAAVTIFSVTKVVQEDAGLISSDGGMFTVLVQA